MELGMRKDEFWDLTWHDFGLWCLRIGEIHKQRFEDQEFLAELARNFMALHVARTGGRADPKDFYKLSYDKKIEDPVEVTESDLKDKIRKLERVAKNKLKRG